MKTIKQYLVILFAFITVALLAYFMLAYIFRDTKVEAVAEEQIDQTPAVLDSIRSIGQWEVTSMDMNVVVDTIKKRWLGLVKDKVQRRYHGRLSLGIDLSKLPQANEACYTRDKDTITLILPDVCLLDTNFIDESRTETLVNEDEEFSQQPEVRQAMMQRAKRRMMSDAMSPKNIAECKRQVTDQMSRRFQTIGYKKVVVAFR